MRSYLGKAWWLTKDGEAIDISSDMGPGTNDHTGFMILPENKELAYKLGLSDKDIEVLAEFYEEGMATEEVGKACLKPFDGGAIRVRKFGAGAVAIDSKAIDESTRRKVVKFFNCVGINPVEVIWEGSGSYRKFNGEIFMSREPLQRAWIREAYVTYFVPTLSKP